MNKRFVAYYRVSTKRQGDSGLGLEAQKKAVEQYVAGRGEVVSEFTEVESGGKNDRPELEKALAICKKGGGVLVIAKLDRLSRDVEFIAHLMKEVTFCAVEFPEADPLMIHIHAAMAEYERKIIGQRVKVALAAAKERGVVLGKHGKAESVAAKARAEQLRAIIRGIRGRGVETLRSIAGELNAMGIKTVRGGWWGAKTVSDLLRRLEPR